MPKRTKMEEALRCCQGSNCVEAGHALLGGPCAGHLDVLTRALRKAIKDKERVRWIFKHTAKSRSGNGPVSLAFQTPSFNIFAGVQSFNAAVDAAIRAESKAGKRK